MSDVLDAFHPLVAGWFRERFGAPTDPQRDGWPRIAAREDVLIAAPTGSGKTLAAFLACLDELVRRGLAGPLASGTAILYISPLKALSNDVQRNLEAPLRELEVYAAARGEKLPEIRVAVRTGDTPTSERAKMARRPPHILVTTPESLFILLTSASGRASLAGLRTVIVDEIHAVAGDKRGAHLAISLERLDRLVAQSTGAVPVRIGLSATQRPIERIARLLVGTRRPLPHIVDSGHRRELDLAIEITDDELAAVASHEQFGRVYDRIAELVVQHRSTIVFVNTRNLVERAAAALEQRLGEEHVVAHHGSMSRSLRLAAEQKLKLGQVKCAVATASLELGIDVGAVDLVVQLGSPRSIATLLQRVGRSGHSLGATPKGRLFALTRDQLVECAALVRGVRGGNLDRIALRDAPLDILAQQIVAATAAEEIAEVELAAMIRGAAPYAELADDKLEQVLTMLAEGVSDRRGRMGAHVHRDRIGGMLRGRRGARIAAITSGGAIPDNNNYTVVQVPEETPVGSIEEDFAIESSAGDIFQLGNTSWRIKRVEAGRVLVEDARGLPPTIPFWLGEAPARTRELSDEVSALRAEVDGRLAACSTEADLDAIAAWLVAETSMPMRAAQQLVAYLAAGRNALGALPRKDLLIAERFFDEGGGMQLVLHSPLGGRVNRAWGLALRKKFCVSFDFELQAAATDDGIVISLGQPHSFPLETVFGFVPSRGAEDTLVQALLDRPMFEIRWRWNVTRSLTVLRRRNGKKVPPMLLKMRVADALSVVFPAAQACPENLPGSTPGNPGRREVPDHPLVFETIRDCLVEAMDLEGLRDLLERLERGEIQVIARDTVEPSPLSHELINANPYAFLDDAPLEERRTRAVSLRRGLPATVLAPGGDTDLGTLDEAAILAAVEEVAPVVRSADELHDALLALWLVPAGHGALLDRDAELWFDGLVDTGRACRVTWDEHPASESAAGASRSDGRDPASPALAFVEAPASPEPGPNERPEMNDPSVGDERPQGRPSRHEAWVATERLGAIRAVLGEDVACAPHIATPSWAARPAREEAIVKITGAHLDHRGPVSARSLAAELGLPLLDVVTALLALEADGAILRGWFSGASGGPRLGATTQREALVSADDSALLEDIEWCNRRVLARIHRLTLARLRREIEPVSAAALTRFLLRWQRVARHTQLIGADGLARVIEQLQGFETAAGAWERELLPARLHGYDPSWLDQMCLAGQVAWCRLSPRRPAVEADEPEAQAATAEAAPRSGKPARGRAATAQARRVAAHDLFSDPYDLAEAGAEAARMAGASREEIAAAAAAAIPRTVPPRVGTVVTSLVTRTAMLRNDQQPPQDLARGSLVDIPVARGERVRDAELVEPRATRVRDDDLAGVDETAARDARGEELAARASAELDARGEELAARAPAELDARGEELAARAFAELDACDDERRARLDEELDAGYRGAGGDSVSFESAAPIARPVRGSTQRAMSLGGARPRPPTTMSPSPVAVPEASGAPPTTKGTRCAPTRSAPLALMLRRDLPWLRAASSCAETEAPAVSATAARVRDHLTRIGASFLGDIVTTLQLAPLEIEDALWELVGAGLATADGFASLRVLVDRKRGEVKSHFDRRPASGRPRPQASWALGLAGNDNGSVAAPGSPPVRSWQEAIKKARTADRTRPGHALRSLPTAAGRWSLLPATSPAEIDAEASARQLLQRYGVVFRDLLVRESSLPPWRDLLVALRRLEARGEIRGGRFVSGFVGEQFALPEALDELRAARNPGASPEACRVAATDPLNLVGVLSPGPRVPAQLGNAVLYLDGNAVASLEAGEVVRRAPIPPGARIDDDLAYHPPPRPTTLPTQAALPL